MFSNAIFKFLKRQESSSPSHALQKPYRKTVVYFYAELEENLSIMIFLLIRFCLKGLWVARYCFVVEH